MKTEIMKQKYKERRKKHVHVLLRRAKTGVRTWLGGPMCRSMWQNAEQTHKGRSPGPVHSHIGCSPVATRFSSRYTVVACGFLSVFPVATLYCGMQFF